MNRSVRWLIDLPQVQPPPHLWARILETGLGRERARRRRLLLVGGLANAAVLMLIVVALLARPPTSPDSESLQALIARSQVLEARLLAYQDRLVGLEAAQRELAAQHQAQLTALDQTLAEAYAGGQSTARLNELWRQRASVVGSLLLIYETPAQWPDRT